MNDNPKPAQIWEVYFPTSDILDIRKRPVVILSYCESGQVCVVVPLSSIRNDSHCCSYQLNPDDFDEPKPNSPLELDFHRIHTIDRKLLNSKRSQIKNNVYAEIVDKLCAMLKTSD